VKRPTDISAASLDVASGGSPSSTERNNEGDFLMSRNPNTDPPQPADQPELPPVAPHDPIKPDPETPQELPLPPDAEPSPPAPVREPDPTPPPAGDPQPSEPTRIM